MLVRRRLRALCVIGAVALIAGLPGTVARAEPLDDITCEGPESDDSSGIFPLDGAPSKSRARDHGGWTPTKWPTGIPNAGDARMMLYGLAVKDKTAIKYHREDFRVDGSKNCWIKQGPDCCSTREIVLQAQSTVPVTLRGKCEVITGRWTSEYDDLVSDNRRDIDIDHIVPLKAAWDSGASTWDVAKRERFANDISPNTPQLIAVSKWSNRRKGDKGPDVWLPADTAVCPYSEAWVAVKSKYGLSVTQDEKDKLNEKLRHC
ncbi:HNH endonuclease family protein [Streptomyces blastmyceticus]|uniref:GmrSD restriction endonucleases C-terminal domain-containing protein n=1 Tax=Streptomyces blastmyceticus TaxID=68180 RepID=A0ABN0WA86_9ACTN